MNPRRSQYALGGTLGGWSRLTTLSARQRRLLRSAYRGRNPFVYSRYGIRQWAAGLPRTRVIVKDPFAMLSIPAVVEATNARPILMFRHPGAVLASYRRMGWTADLDELSAATSLGGGGDASAPSGDLLPCGTETGEAARLGRFWAVLNAQALDDIQSIPGGLVVSHADVASGGELAVRRLLDLCELRVPAALGDHDTRPLAHSVRADRPTSPRLHDFDRPPHEVADAWQTDVSQRDLETLRTVAGDTLGRMESSRVRFTGTGRFSG